MFDHLLRLEPSALQSEYRRLSRIHHPDAGGNTARMAELNRVNAQAKAQHKAATTVNAATTAKTTGAATATAAKANATSTALTVASATPAQPGILARATTAAKAKVGNVAAAVKTGATAAKGKVAAAAVGAKAGAVKGAKVGAFAGPKGLVAGLAVGALGGLAVSAVQSHVQNRNGAPAALGAMSVQAAEQSAGSTWGANAHSSVVPMPIGATTGSAGEGAEISELRRELARMTDETNALYRAMNDTVTNLSEMSVTINAQSDMGRGLANLSNQAAELSRQGVQDLTTIINFMDERIRTSEAGIAEASAAFSGLLGDMNSINWFS